MTDLDALRVAVEKKRAEVVHYQGVLDRYMAGRWLDQGRRHHADLKAELAALEQELADAEQQATR